MIDKSLPILFWVNCAGIVFLRPIEEFGYRIHWIAFVVLLTIAYFCLVLNVMSRKDPRWNSGDYFRVGITGAVSGFYMNIPFMIVLSLIFAVAPILIVVLKTVIPAMSQYSASASDPEIQRLNRCDFFNPMTRSEARQVAEEILTQSQSRNARLAAVKCLAMKANLAILWECGDGIFESIADEDSEISASCSQLVLSCVRHAIAASQGISGVGMSVTDAQSLLKKTQDALDRADVENSKTANTCREIESVMNSFLRKA